MSHASVSLRGQLALEIRDRHGRLRGGLRRHNRVLAAGRAHVAASLVGEVRNYGFSIAVGGNPGRGEDDALTDLLSPLERLPVEEVANDGDRLVCKAAWVADEARKLGESGVILHYENRGSRTRHERLYNRAVIDPVAEVAAGDTVTFTWTITFTAQVD